MLTTDRLGDSALGEPVGNGNQNPLEPASSQGVDHVKHSRVAIVGAGIERHRVKGVCHSKWVGVFAGR